MENKRKELLKQHKKLLQQQLELRRLGMKADLKMFLPMLRLINKLTR